VEHRPLRGNAGRAGLLRAASALTLAPHVAYLPQALRRRERPELLFWAFALLWTAMFLIALNISILAIDYTGENEF
jgi:hypothetical protein